MPLHIGEVKADLDTTMQRAESGAPAAAIAPASMDLNIDRLRPLVLQILEEEMTAFKRQQG